MLLTVFEYCGDGDRLISLSQMLRAGAPTTGTTHLRIDEDSLLTPSGIPYRISQSGKRESQKAVATGTQASVRRQSAVSSKFERNDPLKRFSEKVAIQKTIVNAGVRKKAAETESRASKEGMRHIRMTNSLNASTVTSYYKNTTELNKDLRKEAA